MAVSIKEVAALAKVSVGTVSNVLNSTAGVSPKTVEKVNIAISQLGYVRNDAARQLRAGTSNTIGMLVLDVRNPFFTDIARGAERAASEHGYTILLANSDESSDRESTYLDVFEQQRVRGILITPVGDVTQRLAQLDSHGTDVVLVDSTAPNKTLRSVSVDDVSGGFLAVEHLLETGCRKIAFVGGPLSTPQVADRLTGASDAVSKISGATLQVISTSSLSSKSGKEAAVQLLALDNLPDGIFAANDVLALGMIQEISAQGTLRIPEDIAIIGYDDIEFAESAFVPLSSIRQPTDQMGAQAVELLLRFAEGDPTQTEVSFQPELIIRESTRRLSN